MLYARYVLETQFFKGDGTFGKSSCFTCVSVSIDTHIDSPLYPLDIGIWRTIPTVCFQSCT